MLPIICLYLSSLTARAQFVEHHGQDDHCALDNPLPEKEAFIKVRPARERPEIAIADPGKADLAVDDRGSARRETGQSTNRRVSSQGDDEWRQADVGDRPAGQYSDQQPGAKGRWNR